MRIWISQFALQLCKMAVEVWLMRPWFLGILNCWHRWWLLTTEGTSESGNPGVSPVPSVVSVPAPHRHIRCLESMVRVEFFDQVENCRQRTLSIQMTYLLFPFRLRQNPLHSWNWQNFNKFCWSSIMSFLVTGKSPSLTEHGDDAGEICRLSKSSVTVAVRPNCWRAHSASRWSRLIFPSGNFRSSKQSLKIVWSSLIASKWIWICPLPGANSKRPQKYLMPSMGFPTCSIQMSNLIWKNSCITTA